MQAAFVAEDWVDHTLGQAREAEGKLEATKKAYAEIEKRLKDILFHLAKVEKSRKKCRVCLGLVCETGRGGKASQKKTKSQLALAMVKAKQQQKQLEAKDAEMAKAE